MNPLDCGAWKNLTRLATRDVMADQTAAEPLTGAAAGVFVDLTKQRLGPEVLAALIELAETQRLADERSAMFAGEAINGSEQRAVLHTALRAPAAARPAQAQAVEPVMARLAELVEAVRSGAWRGFTGKAITDVVHIGIGGSHFGPELGVSALATAGAPAPRIRFLANVDPVALARALGGLNPERTLIVVASKSFTTLETGLNARAARNWFLERTGDRAALARHFVAISSNLEAAGAFGIPADNVFEMWDWVGGRYSVWSAVGLPLALAIGNAGFAEFLAGARAMDEHFQTAPLDRNLPVLLALTSIWNYNFRGVTNHAILPYAERLALLPDFLQQLTMESNGKRVHRDGTPVGMHTMPIVWGGPGTNGQHAYHQLLHQGTRAFTADFILVAEPTEPAEHHRWLLANGLAQSQAMLLGQHHDNPHRQVPGKHATNTIVLDRLSPGRLGALLALYEHMVFCQGVIWDINSFDQWGVELGKQLAGPIYEQLGGKSAIRQDASTRTLIELIRRLES